MNAARSVLRIEARSAGDLAIAGYASGTAGLPEGLGVAVLLEDVS